MFGRVDLEVQQGATVAVLAAAGRCKSGEKLNRVCMSILYIKKWQVLESHARSAINVYFKWNQCFPTFLFKYHGPC